MQESAKLDWLIKKLPAMIDSGEVLVFANQIVRVEEITEKIKSIGHRQGHCLLRMSVVIMKGSFAVLLVIKEKRLWLVRGSLV